MRFHLPPASEAMMDAYTEQEHLLYAGLLDPDQPTLYTHMVENRRLMQVRLHRGRKELRHLIDGYQDGAP